MSEGSSTATPGATDANEGESAAPAQNEGAPAVPWKVKKSFVHAPWFKRFLIAHTTAYPVCLPYAVAFIPILLRTLTDDELHAPHPESLIMHRLIMPTLVSFAIAHLVALPWVFGKNTARGKKLLIALDAFLVSVGFFGALVAWWLLLYKWSI